MPRRPVDILIPNYECADELEACLASLREFTADGYHVTVVDNGSSPATVERLSAYCANQPHTSLIVDEGPSGFSHAINRGLSEIGETDSDLVILNNDTVVTPDWLEELQYVLWRHPDVGMAVPRQVLLPGVKTIRVHVPGAMDTYECDVNLSNHHGNILDPAFDARDGLVELSFAPLFAGLVRAETMRSLAGLNARNGSHYRSDWIFCDALRRVTQSRIVYTPHSKIYHLQGVASRTQVELAATRTGSQGTKPSRGRKAASCPAPR
jgi:GT2 family glycosyltransferase